MTDEKKARLEFESFNKKLVNFQPEIINFNRRRRATMGSDDSSLEFSVERAREIVSSGTIAEKRDLSNYMYSLGGIYTRTGQLFSTMCPCNIELIPILLTQELNDMGIKNYKKSVLESQIELDNSDFSADIQRALLHLFKDGAYYGIIRKKEDGYGYFLYDMPISYCNVNSKDMYNRYDLDFNLSYFDSIKSLNGRKAEDVKESILLSMPVEIQNAYYQYKKGTIDKWITIESDSAFCIIAPGRVPLLASAIPDLIRLEEAKDTEQKLDSRELDKIITNALPLGKDGELIFDLDEAGEMHATMAKILADKPYIDLLTGFGKMELLNLKDSNGSAQKDRLQKSERAANSALGTSANIFNGSSSNSTDYSIKFLEGMIFNFLSQMEPILSMIFSEEYGRNRKFDFSLKILKFTIFTKKEFLEELSKNAQNGYPVKTTAMIAKGFTQQEIMGKYFYENEILKLQEKMIPVKSSHTGDGNIEDKGGAPTKEQPTEKTIANREVQ